ncbi:MAG TPA: hypothetical protein VLK25_02810 [Allosphingosinicella sp.]|nr:hypothetical protein [Allosphingosinicella sp.]
MKVSAALLSATLVLAACGQPVPGGNGNDGSTTPAYVPAENEATTLNQAMVPVPVGEQGPSFAACGGRGATRDAAGAEPVPVRAAPYDAAAEIDRLPAGATFFICARTFDQRWSGIVYDEGGEASARCGVAGPIAERRNYAGPCAAGWVPTARVRLVSGEPHQLSQGAAPAP